MKRIAYLITVGLLSVSLSVMASPRRNGHGHDKTPSHCCQSATRPGQQVGCDLRPGNPGAHMMGNLTPSQQKKMDKLHEKFSRKLSKPNLRPRDRDKYIYEFKREVRRILSPSQYAAFERHFSPEMLMPVQGGLGPMQQGPTPPLMTRPGL